MSQLHAHRGYKAKRNSVSLGGDHSSTIQAGGNTVQQLGHSVLSARAHCPSSALRAQKREACLEPPLGSLLGKVDPPKGRGQAFEKGQGRAPQTLVRGPWKGPRSTPSHRAGVIGVAGVAAPASALGSLGLLTDSAQFRGVDRGAVFSMAAQSPEPCVL